MEITIDSADFEGQWWLRSEDRTASIGGTLRYRRSEPLQLNLIGAIGSSAKRSGTQVIWGVTSEGERVTLGNCFETNLRLVSKTSGSESQRWHVGHALMGAHLADVLETEVETVSTTLDVLPSLVAHPDFDIALDPKPTMSVTRPSGLATTWRDFEISLEYRDSFDPYPLGEGYDYRIRPEFRCRPSETASLAEIQSTVLSPLRNLCSLLAGRMSANTGVRIRSKNSEMRGERYLEPEWRLLYQPVGTGEPTEKLLSPLFMLNDQPEFASVVSSWLDASSRGAAAGAIAQHFSTQDAPAAFVEVRFLSLAYTIEDYHRAVIGGTRRSEEAHNEQLGRFRTALAAQGTAGKEIKWLIGNLRFSNELAFEQRVNEVILTVQSAVDEVIGDIGRFSQIVAATRNYLVHRTPQLQDRAAEGPELFWMEQALKLVASAIMIREASYPEERIAEAFKRSATSRWVRDNVSAFAWGLGN